MRWAAANSNLALVKYWGKRRGEGNQAARGSVSVTLDGLQTVAGVAFVDGRGPDLLEEVAEPARAPVGAFLDSARQRLGIDGRARVVLVSNFPVAAGLASSASTFAALAVASAAAAERALRFEGLADLARCGSGSACRSLLGGFVEWIPDASTETVRVVAPIDHWPLAVLVAVVTDEPKRLGSREGMSRTASSSPYFEPWLDAGSRDLVPARAAVERRDLTALGEIAERNCLRMHAATIASDPPLFYWEPATVAVMREVWRIRETGVAAYFTIDAGPQVKVLCDGRSAASVEERLRDVPGVRAVLVSGPGRGAELLDAPPAWAIEAAARRAVAAC